MKKVSGKPMVPITVKIPASISYKLGGIDAKLAQNDEVHQEIMKRLDTISTTLGSLREDAATLTAESTARHKEMDGLSRNIDRVCDMLGPVKEDLATTRQQSDSCSGRITILETSLTGVKSEVDKTSARAGMIGGAISLIVAGLVWLGKQLFGHLAGG